MDLSRRSLLLSLSTRAFNFFIPKWLCKSIYSFKCVSLLEEVLDSFWFRHFKILIIPKYLEHNSIVLYFTQKIDAPTIRFLSQISTEHLNPFTQTLCYAHAAVFDAQDRFENQPKNAIKTIA